MNKLTYKIGTGIAGASLLALSIAPAVFADTNVTIGGNGAFTDNNVSVRDNSATTVLQSNTSSISNDVSSYNNTGGNESSYNTGGTNSISTGDASSNVSITNVTGGNTATVNSCGCTSGNTNLNILGNGYGSYNRIYADTGNNTYVSQYNDGYLRNNVYSKNNTGYNDENGNTGGYFWGGYGNNSIDTGNSTSNVYLDNMTGWNTLY